MRAWQRRHRLNHVAHIGELREGFRRQERANLEMPHTRGVFIADPSLFGIRRGDSLDELQAVAQPDFAQGHAAFRVDVSNGTHARLPAALAVEAISCASISCPSISCPSSSARIAEVSAPSGGTFRPSPILAPFHSIGSAGTRNAAPSALKLLTRPPGLSTC